MSKELEKAGKNLLYKLSPNKDGVYFNFKPTESDFKDLKTVLGWINRQTELSLKNNTLFAKLFIYELTMEIRSYGTTVLNPLPLNKLSSILKKPLPLFYDAFYKDLINNQLNKLVEFDEINEGLREDIANAEENYPNYEGITTKEDYIEKKQSQIITEEKRLDVIKEYNELKKTFTYDFVIDKLNSNIVESINKFS
tara:strand:- start:941 stop:1528 length:588 start_codon:yes stop_codon:yes gene_type:complete